MALSPTTSRGGIPNPVTTQIVATPPAGASGLKITPVNPNATGDNTTAIEIDLPQTVGPNFPNIYAMRVVDPDTGNVPFLVYDDGSVEIRGQPFSLPLEVVASTVNPGTRLALFIDSNGTALFELRPNARIGFYGATPVAQHAAIADAAGGVVIDAEARAALNTLLAGMRSLGLIAT